LSAPAGNPTSISKLGDAQQREAGILGGLTTQALPAARAAPTLRPKICIG
jgi:hypothetical protein